MDRLRLVFHLAYCITSCMFERKGIQHIRCAMHKTVTLRLRDAVYKKMKTCADDDNRPLSNFIETATLRYIQQREHASAREMKIIQEDADLIRSLKRGIKDAQGKKGKFVRVQDI